MSSAEQPSSKYGAQGEFKISSLISKIFNILGPERDFYSLAMIYGVGISLLSLATPISVQMLINTVANTGLAAPLIVLSLTLFGLLLMSGLLNAMRIHLMEIFGRRFYARLVSEIAIRALYAKNPFFHDDGRGPLFNRYFDIVIVQKTMPGLFIGGFTLILQAGVGFVLVSFYHPLFLAFNAVLVALLWAVWLVWGKKAISTSINLSHRKHMAAAWLEGLAASNGFFKTPHHIAYALTQTDAVTGRYIDEHRQHFRQHFSQAISFLIIYAAASAALLGLGGWLVIQGQLSLGQLVAAELVLSAVFFGISQLSYYLVYFYDLCAAVEELSLFLDVELEEPDRAAGYIGQDASLSFVDVRGESRGAPTVLNFEIPCSATVMATTQSHGLQRLITNLLKRREPPHGGYVALGGADISDADTSTLHQEIIVLDRPTVIEMSIREYLHLSAEDVSPPRVLEVLKLVGLNGVVAQFEDGLDTHIASTGWPLSITETMLLKLASAIISRPKVLVLNQLYDLVAEDCLARAIAHLQADKSNTVLYFTRRRRNLGFDTFLYAEPERQFIFENFENFAKVAYGENGSLESDEAGDVYAKEPPALVGKH
ncbi:MAG: ABC transporter ATP-binding protein [Pseudomonadota bacterium]